MHIFGPQLTTSPLTITHKLTDKLRSSLYSSDFSLSRVTNK